MCYPWTRTHSSRPSGMAPRWWWLWVTYTRKLLHTSYLISGDTIAICCWPCQQPLVLHLLLYAIASWEPGEAKAVAQAPQCQQVGHLVWTCWPLYGDKEILLGQVFSRPYSGLNPFRKILCSSVYTNTRNSTDCSLSSSMFTALRGPSCSKKSSYEADYITILF